MALALNTTISQNGTTTLPPYEDRGPSLLAVAWLETIIALGFVGARMYCRGRILRNIGWDDWTILFAFLLGLISTICITVEVQLGVGTHIVYLTPDRAAAVSKWLWIRQPFCTFCAAFGKVSIAFLFMRIMNGNKRQEIFLWFVIFLLLAINLALIVVTFVGCTPVWELWQGPHPNPNCWDPHITLSVGYAQATWSAFSDFLFAIFPYFVIRNLQIDRKTKLSLVLLLSLGIFATVAAVMKVLQLSKLDSKDYSWDATDLAYWVATEDFAIIIGACIPTLKPLFKQRQTQLGPSSTSRSVNHKQSLAQHVSGKIPGTRSVESPDISLDKIPLKNRSEVVSIDDKGLTDDWTSPRAV